MYCACASQVCVPHDAGRALYGTGRGLSTCALWGVYVVCGACVCVEVCVYVCVCVCVCVKVTMLPDCACVGADVSAMSKAALEMKSSGVDVCVCGRMGV